MAPDKKPTRDFRSESVPHSFGFAWSGFCHALGTERNLQIHMGTSVLVVVMGWTLHVSKTHWLVLLLTMALMISMELVNTAIEHLADVVCDGQHHDTIRLVKDIAAAACLVVAVFSVAIGLVIFAPPVLIMLSTAR